MKKTVYMIVSFIFFAFVLFLGFNMMTYRFYKSPDQKIIAIYKMDETDYRTIEILPDNLMVLTVVQKDSKEFRILKIKYDLTGRAMNQIVGPLFYRHSSGWIFSLMWKPGLKIPPYVVNGKIIETIPRMTEEQQKEFNITNTVLIIGQDYVDLGGIVFKIGESVPDWVQHAIDQ